MPSRKNRIRRLPAIMESAGDFTPLKTVTESIRLADGVTKFHDEKFVIENAALFGPPFDAESGHYISNRGTHYAPGFHESLMEAADGAMGWDSHPDGLNGAKQMRPTSKATHKVLESSTWIDKTGTAPLLRGDIKFVGKDKASNYEIAKEAAHKFGFSAFVPRPLGKFDARSGVDVVHRVDPSEKRNVSFDLVEASGATGDITESAAEHRKLENTMDPEQIKKLIADALEAALSGRDEKLKTSLLKDIEPGLKAGKEALAEAATIKRTQLVQSRLAEKKLATEDTTSALVTQLSLCESADAMDKLIDEQKSFLAKRTPTVSGAGGGQTREDVEVGRMRGMIAVMESCGYKGATTPAQRVSAFRRFQDTPMGMAVLSPASESLGEAGRWSYQHRNDEEVKKLRREFIESASFRQIYRMCYGADMHNVRDVAEANLDVDSSSFLGVNTALLSAILIDAYEVAGKNLVADDITYKYDSQLRQEVIPGYTAPTGLGEQVTEGDLAPVISIGSKGCLDHNILKLWGRVIITREEYLYDQKGMVIMRANSIAEQIRVYRDIRKLLVITDQSAYTAPGTAASRSWQQYLPMTAGSNTTTPTYSQTNIFQAGLNLIKGNPLGNYQNVEKAVDLLKAQIDENGNRLFANGQRPLVVLIPDTLEFAAWHIFNATGTQLRTEAQEHIVEGGNPFAGTTIHMSSSLSTIQANTAQAGGDPIGTWYIAGATGFQRQYVDKRVIPFEAVQVPQAEVQAVSADVIAGVKVSYKEDVVPRDYRYVVKCTPV